MISNNQYDIIIVGGGHAGCEAAMAAANLGSNTLLITMNMQTIAQMSCNPAMGGIAKGQIIREIDALGGYSGIISDNSMIQFKMLNQSKGPAMWSPRCQSDKMKFSKCWKTILEKNKKLSFYQDTVLSLIIKNNQVNGIITKIGNIFYAKAVILTNGTFLNGEIHIGEKKFEGGRIGETKTKHLTTQLINLGFKVGRMKTGTSPRVDSRSIDFSKMEEQLGDENPGKFSYTKTNKLIKQKKCYITHTNTFIHEIIKENLHKSPIFNGSIKSKGPRYCPSIEDKIYRFVNRDHHQIFFEPEGLNTIETYINGFSTSLPIDIQLKTLQLIPGCKNIKIFKPGYSVEYDYFPPNQLNLTLNTKLIKNLFFAGQINGTTGYEEAACQGLIAGINAHQQINNNHEFILKRNQAYIGVLIDDLVTKGTNEPYRMFTSRAEYRLILRQDNADERLTPLGVNIGLAHPKRLNNLNQKLSITNQLIKKIQNYSTSKEEINDYLIQKKSSPIKQKQKLISIIKRPNIKLKDILILINNNQNILETKYHHEIIELAEIKIKYKGYIEKEKKNVIKLHQLEKIKIPKKINYLNIQSITEEAKEKLYDIQPKTIGQASRISGISPSDINVLLIYLKKIHLTKKIISKKNIK